MTTNTKKLTISLCVLVYGQRHWQSLHSHAGICRQCASTHQFEHIVPSVLVLPITKTLPLQICTQCISLCLVYRSDDDDDILIWRWWYSAFHRFPQNSRNRSSDVLKRLMIKEVIINKRSWSVTQLQKVFIYSFPHYFFLNAFEKMKTNFFSVFRLDTFELSKLSPEGRKLDCW